LNNMEIKMVTFLTHGHKLMSLLAIYAVDIAL
jgi:hypothetical protein